MRLLTADARFVPNSAKLFAIATREFPAESFADTGLRVNHDLA
jgi:hypothetical protein